MTPEDMPSHFKAVPAKGISIASAHLASKKAQRI